MNGDQDYILAAEAPARGVCSANALLQRDVIIFWYQELGVEATVDEVSDYAPCDFTGVNAFAEKSVGGALARSEYSVAGVDENLHTD